MSNTNILHNNNAESGDLSFFILNGFIDLSESI